MSSSQPPLAPPPRKPTVLGFGREDEWKDEFEWRKYMAREAASQTRSQHAMEHYARRVHRYVAIWFWYSAVGAIGFIILMSVLVTHAMSTP